MRRVQPVQEKEARLGADAWGGTDARIRQVMDPIEELFDKEFPSFDPFPWGRRAWPRTLVRNIMLAEPMVGDFGRCFEGVGPE
ncbi:hypothetical protein FE391_28645 [Nonomuraea sp. KC401]|uniref:hypothetical protein n=1 Tax=unclassified Nonomuraea TaxID=2593643 RepID=UPI0010FE25AE|nr:MULTISPECIES: hypothetical protein [unclassified Nonomuraea]NBE97711.1 hypothetical protein [Nonomuraea sp. K271]TLF63831.1 hypothetical protein FE391_28645 [Nonomuraea sp. KC401]